MEELQFTQDRPAFRRVAEVSIQLDELYSSTLGKWVSAVSTPMSAQLLETLHPMRVSRLAFATRFNPLLRALAAAEHFRRDRHAVPEANVYKAAERKTFDVIHDLITEVRRLRDLGYELWFEALYGGRWVGANPAGEDGPPESAQSSANCRVHGAGQNDPSP